MMTPPDNSPSATAARCQLCGEPMPPGEEMFKYHGFSCDCPKPSLAKTEVMVEYIFRDMRNGEFWIDIKVQRQPWCQIGPFASEAERQRAHDDLLNMTRASGAKDFPSIAEH